MSRPSGNGDGELTWRERLYKANAEIKEAELARLRGELLPAAEVLATWRGRISNTRARLLAIPSKIAPQIAPPGKLAQTAEALRREIYEALNELAGGHAED